MYTQVWLKFLPVIRIMLKRAVTENQVVKMNRTDFDKAGGGKKAGFSFTIEYSNGKVQNRPTSVIAKDLIALLQEDRSMDILRGRKFELEMSPKCELRIRCLDSNETAENAPGVNDNDAAAVPEDNTSGSLD